MAPSKKRIVIIDDNLVILAMVENLLTKAGYEAVTLTEPSREKLVDEKIDLLLLDINMPQIFGDDAAKHIREAWGVTAPIYLFSSVPEEELTERAARAGVDGYICKSWGTERFLVVVQAVIGPALE